MSLHAHPAGSAVHAPMAEPSGFIRKYIFSVDHKVIRHSVLPAGVDGGAHRNRCFRLLMRFHLVCPERDAAVRQAAGQIAGAVFGAR